MTTRTHSNASSAGASSTVIVRPVILTSWPKTKAYRALVDPRDWTCGFISRADVADFLVKQIDNDAFLHKTPVLTS
jgi:NAD(P)H-binding